MKLNNINKIHIERAANQINQQGIPKDYVWSQYYVVVNGKEYPFKHLVRTAYELATNEKLQFQSNESYRDYIKSLGFEFRYYEGGYNFFNKEELEFYSSIANKDYRTSNKEQQFYGQQLYPIIAKAKYWAEQILIEGFKLKQDGNWLNGHVARIKPYFWPRIYSGEDKDVFFNVEVNGAEKFIGYKLDGYYETTKALPGYKIKILDNFKKEINLEWPKINFADITDYGWDRLIKESKDYVQKYLTYHDKLKKLLSKELKIARITWNTNGWVKPSGRTGKSKNPSFEFEHGFGHEEWLFDGDKVINGYKYGFLEPVNKFRSNYIGKTFDISLFTFDGENKTDNWVTTLYDVEIITIEEAEVVLNIYKNEGWYNAMKEDLFNLNLNTDQLDEWIKEDSSALFNIKFKASQIYDIPVDLIPIESKSDIPTTRYNLMDITLDIQQKYAKKVKTGFSFDNSGSEDADLQTKGKRTGSGKEIELELKHNIIQEKLLKYLQNKFGESCVRRECSAYGASRIDIVRKTATGFIFYEIKTYNSLQFSIRNSIGQLLEYCLYPAEKQAEELIIVSHIDPSEEVEKYINHLKNFISIPFSYIYFDTDSEEIIKKI